MIFSAGLGSRFKPWTLHHPKALALVNGKTLLQHNIEYLQKYNIKDVVVNVHHYADQVVSAINENKGWGSNVIISDESDELLETGGGLWKAKEHFKDDTFITVNVDILTNLDINKLISFHEACNALISFGITNRHTSRYFLFDNNNRLCGWRNTQTGMEKIVSDIKPLYQKAYSCVAVFQPKVFDLIQQRGNFSLTEPYLSLASEHTIMGYDHSGDKLVDVGKPESIALAETMFK